MSSPYARMQLRRRIQSLEPDELAQLVGALRARGVLPPDPNDKADRDTDREVPGIEREPDVDRNPVGELSTHLDPTMRWGGTQVYSFEQQTVAPPIYFSSQLLAQAKSGRPRTWTCLMMATFDPGSEWQGTHLTHWQAVFQLLCGAGQANIPLTQTFTGSPVDGFTPPGAASALAPFANVVAFWEAVPAAEINAQVIFKGDKIGSPAFFTGEVSALLAPYYPTEAPAIGGI